MLWPCTAAKKQDKDWIKEERYEESGDWIDKRPGERGSYGRLDREREAERADIYHAGRIQELIREIEKEMDWIPGRHTRLIREKVDSLIVWVNMIQAGKNIAQPTDISVANEQAEVLKKIILKTFFDLFPDLLNADIQHLKFLDSYVLEKAAELADLNN